MTRLFVLVLACATLASRGQVAPVPVEVPFQSWLSAGERVFVPNGNEVQVAWDSAKRNSYLYLPLGLTLTSADDFDVTLVFRVDDLAIGTTAGKPYTFEIGAGLINLTNALDPAFFRGSGINGEHGPRNLVEWDYFPASGFITATVAPTIATAQNQVLFSDNHPMALEFGASYKVVMSFTGNDRTLRSRLWKSTSPTDFPGDGQQLKALVLTSGYGDFAVDTLALANYDDGGQNPPQFSGSLRGTGVFSKAQVVIYNRPVLQAEKREAGILIRYQTTTGWRYQLQTKRPGTEWEPAAEPVNGSDSPVSTLLRPVAPIAMYRVAAERM